MVFLFGSVKLKKIPDNIITVLDTYPDSTEVILGDAHGIDTAFQRYLAGREMKNVTVVGIRPEPRNFLCKQWNYINYNSSYAQRDLYMVQQCTEAFCIWNGESKGTKASINNLVLMKKPICITIP